LVAVTHGASFLKSRCFLHVFITRLCHVVEFLNLFIFMNLMSYKTLDT